MTTLATTFAGEERAEVPVLVAFLDLTGFAAQCARVSDDELAEVVDDYYVRVAAGVTAAGGRVVKYIGDAALAVFDPADADRAVVALLALKEELDAWFAHRRWDCQVHAKAHVGTAIAGPFGPPGDRRFDVLGKAVNAAAMLDSTGVTLSAEAFAALSPATRARFKAHATPVTYLRVEDRPRFRRR